MEALFQQHKGDFDVADRWEPIGMDSQNGLQDFGTSQRVGQEVHIEQRFGVPVETRTRCESSTTTSNQTAFHGRPISRLTAARPG
jgi:hypothetical protein